MTDEVVIAEIPAERIEELITAITAAMLRKHSIELTLSELAEVMIEQDSDPLEISAAAHVMTQRALARLAN
jgi:hypothetical protein